MSPIHRERGVTLVELLVAMLITFVVVAAAAYLYLNTRESQRAVNDAATANDTGMFAMQLIGRELMNAGFFPTVWNKPGYFNTLSYDSYLTEVVTDANQQQAYRWGIFGCEGRRFDPATGTCVAGTAGSADSLVVAHFTMDIGDNAQRVDCRGNNVDNDDTYNRGGAGGRVGNVKDTDEVPKAPLFVANAFYLQPTDVNSDAGQVRTFSLACRGNGQSAASATNNSYTGLVSGVEDMQVTYGLQPAAGTTPSATGFVTATDVGTDWQRVVAVRVCLLVRVPNPGTKLAEGGKAARTYVDCNNQTVAQAAADTSIRKTYVQVFGVRNRQSMTY